MKRYKEITDTLDFFPALIIVNDGSAISIAEEDIDTIRQNVPDFRWIAYSENKGKGYALRKGVELAVTDIVIYTDIDFPYTTDSLLNIYNELNSKNCELAVGVKDDAYYDRVPATRKFISRSLQRMVKFFFNIPVADTQCGLKGFVKKIQQHFLNTTIDRYLFDLEFIRIAHKKGIVVKPVPIRLNDNIVFRRMNYRILIPECMNFLVLLFKSGK